ncbi:MAG: hypothetical protein ACRDVN_11385 [Jiangellaceae bacterium]
MASHSLIETHLTALRLRLPADAADELADGLIETFHHHALGGLTPERAAAAAIAEFGAVDQITTAFIRRAPGHRAALALLATGPAVGGCWAASLITAHAWTWPLPTGIGIAFGAILLGTVALLLTVATDTTSYMRTRLTALGGTGLIVLDTAMITAVALAAPTMAWPMVIAITASLARIGLTARALARILAT